MFLHEWQNYIILSKSILSYVSITLVKEKKYLLHKNFLTKLLLATKRFYTIAIKSP